MATQVSRADAMLRGRGAVTPGGHAGLRRPMHRHRRLVGLAALGAAALAAFVLAYFEPQKLFIDDRVAEALPSAAAVRTLAAGTFRSYEHSTSGRARVIATADGHRYLRFENFETSNGPALKVYLSVAPANG